MKVNVLFRNPQSKGKSIENVFNLIYDNYKNFKYLPNSNFDLFSVTKNLIYVAKLKGLIHVTGDIHYVCIVPFKKFILTVHDTESILKGNIFLRLFKKIFWFYIPFFNAKKITVISNFTKKQVLKEVPWVKDKLVVINNPINPNFIFNPKNTFNEKPLILHIGTKENKNLENTILALVGIKCKIIIVGKLNNKYLDLLKKKKSDYENFQNISFENLKKLYEKSDLVSFISKYEGFGLPVIEAQSVGRPVITSNCEAIVEIAGDSVLYVNPFDISDINNGFKKIINNKELREELVNRGRENIKKFNLDIIKKQYKEICQNV